MIKNFREIIKKELNGDMEICFRIDSYHINDDVIYNGKNNNRNKLIKLALRKNRVNNNCQVADDLEQQYISCSFITKTMLEYDSFIFEKLTNFNNAKYDNNEKTKFIKNNRPYFCSFSITDINSINMFLNAYKLDDEIHFAKIVKSNKNDNILNINLIHGFSPVVMSGRKLQIVDKKDKYFNCKANKLYKYEKESIKKCTPKNVDKIINNEIPNCKITGVNVFRVGNGNCNFINFDKKNKGGILYDIGYNCKSIPSKDYKNCKYSNSTKLIRKLTPSCVIISHWDMDHYIGCAYSSDKIFKVKWIAPRFEIEKSFNSLRLGVYLAKLNNLVLLDKKYKYNPNDKIKLNIGSCNDGKVSEKNRRGIYLYITETVSGKDINLLLTGDVPYNCYYNKLYDLSFLVAPHHGADMNFNKTDYQLNIFYANEYKEKIAIISCNNNKNSINRPIKKHVDYLNNDMHFVVLTTESGNDKYKSNNKNGYFHYDLLNPKKTKFI